VNSRFYLIYKTDYFYFQNKPATLPQTVSQVKPVATVASSSQPTSVTVPLPTAQPAQLKPAAFDLLGDLGGDPFAAPVNKPAEAVPGEYRFKPIENVCFLCTVMCMIIIMKASCTGDCLHYVP